MRPPRFVLCCAVVMALTGPPAWAAEPPRPPQSALNKIRDLTATVRARRVLHDDPSLAKLNLGVEVENGVATVWGPVPSLAVGHIAAMKLEGLKGVEKVKSSFYIQEPTDSILTVRPDDPPARVEVAKPRDEAVKVNRPKPAASLAELAKQLQQSEARFQGVGVEVKDGTVLVRRADVAGRDVMDLVEKLRRIPGVRDVILTSD